MKISREAEKEIRSFAIRHANGYVYTAAPITIEDGKLSPHWEGSSFHYETKGGRHIYHPSAYSKMGWSNMKYIPSTRHIVVGKEWLKKLEIDLIQVKLSRQRGKIVSRDLAKFMFYFISE